MKKSVFRVLFVLVFVLFLAFGPFVSDVKAEPDWNQIACIAQCQAAGAGIPWQYRSGFLKGCFAGCIPR